MTNFPTMVGIPCIGYGIEPCLAKAILKRKPGSVGQMPTRCPKCRHKQRDIYKQRAKERHAAQLLELPITRKGTLFPPLDYPGRAELQNLARLAGLLKDR